VVDDSLTPRAPPALDRALRVLPWLVGVLGLLNLALTVALRLPSPWPLEWMEGGVMHHALRLSRGDGLYVAPDARFVPYLYPPLAYVPMAIAVALAGPSLPLLRAVSLLAVLCALPGIGRMGARAAGGRPLAGLACAGLFALGFGYTGGFLDLVRVDAIFVALLVWGVERLQAGRTRPGLWLLAASALAKQHGVLLLAAASVGVLWRGRRAALPQVVPPWLALVGAGVMLELGSGGWFARYVIALPASHGTAWPLLLSFFAVDLLLYLPLLTLVAALSLGPRLRALDPVALSLAAALLAGALGRAHPGGHDNVRMPAFALLCALGLAPVMGALLDRAARRSTRIALGALLSVQAAMLWQPPIAHRPRPETTLRFARLHGALQRCADGGTSAALDHALLTGEPLAHTMALSDLSLGRGDPALDAAARGALLAHLRSPRAPRALAVGERFPELGAVLDARYEPCELVEAPPMPTGYQPPAQRIYRLRD
jgi:hypothetical protein